MHARKCFLGCRTATWQRGSACLSFRRRLGHTLTSVISQFRSLAIYGNLGGSNGHNNRGTTPAGGFYAWNASQQLGGGARLTARCMIPCVLDASVLDFGSAIAESQGTFSGRPRSDDAAVSRESATFCAAGPAAASGVSFSTLHRSRFLTGRIFVDVQLIEHEEVAGAPEVLHSRS